MSKVQSPSTQVAKEGSNVTRAVLVMKWAPFRFRRFRDCQTVANSSIYWSLTCLTCMPSAKLRQTNEESSIHRSSVMVGSVVYELFGFQSNIFSMKIIFSKNFCSYSSESAFYDKWNILRMCVASCVFSQFLPGRFSDSAYSSHSMVMGGWRRARCQRSTE